MIVGGDHLGPYNFVIHKTGLLKIINVNRNLENGKIS